MNKLISETDVFDGLGTMSISKLGVSHKVVRLYSRKTGELIGGPAVLKICNACSSCKFFYEDGEDLIPEGGESDCCNPYLNNILSLERQSQQGNVITLRQPGEVFLDDLFSDFKVKTNDICPFWQPIDPLGDFQDRIKNGLEQLF